MERRNVFISFDIEGVGGVTSWRETRKDAANAGVAWRLATAEVNAVIKGVRAAGVPIGRILVCDAHAQGENLIPDELEPGIELVKGTQRSYYMMEGLDARFHIAFLVGYHAMAGTARAQMDHSYSSASIYRIRINDREVGETAINAAVAGHFRVPVGLVSGDDALAREVRAFLGRRVEFVTTKQAISRYAARCRSPLDVRKGLSRCAARAMLKIASLRPFTFRKPLRVELEVVHSLIGDVIERIPGLKRRDGRRFTWRSPDILDCYRRLMLVCDLAAYANAVLNQ